MFFYCLLLFTSHSKVFSPFIHLLFPFVVHCSSVCVSLQVALMVAAEFWEQGDLERSVLDQQPIVRVLPPSLSQYFIYRL